MIPIKMPLVHYMGFGEGRVIIYISQPRDFSRYAAMMDHRCKSGQLYGIVNSCPFRANNNLSIDWSFVTLLQLLSISIHQVLPLLEGDYANETQLFSN